MLLSTFGCRAAGPTDPLRSRERTLTRKETAATAELQTKGKGELTPPAAPRTRGKSVTARTRPPTGRRSSSSFSSPSSSRRPRAASSSARRRAVRRRRRGGGAAAGAGAAAVVSGAAAAGGAGAQAPPPPRASARRAPARGRAPAPPQPSVLRVPGPAPGPRRPARRSAPQERPARPPPAPGSAPPRAPVPPRPRPVQRAPVPPRRRRGLGRPVCLLERCFQTLEALGDALVLALVQRAADDRHNVAQQRVIGDDLLDVISVNLGHGHARDLRGLVRADRCFP